MSHYGILQPRGFPGLPEDWSSEIETYPSHDGKAQIFSVLHQARSGGPRALIISHGIGEHGGRYLHFPHFLSRTVDAVFCPDHLGHGRSEGLRGHIDHFEDFSEDFVIGILRLDERLRKKHGRSEIHALGHSMGSLILLNAALKHSDLPLKSLTVSSPLLGIRAKVPLVKKAGAGVMAKVWGNLQMRTGLNAAELSHDNEVVEAYQKDRLVHDLCTPKLYVGMTESMKALANGPEKALEYPILFQIPMADAITDPEAALAFYRGLKSREKVLKTYPGFFHESYNESGKKQVFEDLEAWILQNSNGNSSR